MSARAGPGRKKVRPSGREGDDTREAELRPECVYVDESMAVASGTYVVSAVFVRREERPSLVGKVTGLLLPGQSRLHWRNESGPRRTQIVQELCSTGVHGESFAVQDVAAVRQERARAKALEALLWSMRERQVSGLIIESRGVLPDGKDRRTIAAAITARRAPVTLVYRHRPSSDEPLLWVADAIAGAQQARLGSSGPVDAFELGTLGGLVVVDAGGSGHAQARVPVVRRALPGLTSKR